MSTDLFDTNTDPKPVDPPQADPEQDYVTALVGEGKKFSDVESLARGKHESDLYIEQLKKENAGLREDLTQRLSVEDLVEKVASSAKEASVSTATPDAEPASPQIGGSAQVSQEDIAALVEAQVNSRLNEQEKQANRDFVEAEVRKAYGENFKQVLTSKAKEMGIGIEFLANVASDQPKAFLKLMVDEKNDGPPVTSGIPHESVNVSAPSKGTRKNFASYEELRRTNPAEYWKPSVQNEMFEQLKVQGDDFYS